MVPKHLLIYHELSLVILFSAFEVKPVRSAFLSVLLTDVLYGCS